MSGCLTLLLCLTLAGAQPEDQPLDPFKAAETIRLFTFDNEQDRTLDKLPQPADWSRRRGPLFPEYVDAYVDPIDVPADFTGPRALRFKLNGGQATYYSPAIRITPDHAFGLEASIRTEGLVHDAAFVSLSFLNYKHQRITRYLSRPVMGTHEEYQRVQIGPFNPRSDYKFVVIGCHLMAGAKMDIQGDAWFDDLRLAGLPLVQVTTQSGRHYFIEGDPVIIEARVLGRESGKKRHLMLELETAESDISNPGEVIQWSRKKVIAGDADLDNTDATYLWDLSELKHKDGPFLNKGFYRVRATFERDGVSIIQKETTFAVMERAKPGSRGKFGWSLTQGAAEMQVPELAEVAAQGGVNWIKYPLWSEDNVGGASSSEGFAQLMERLTRKDIQLVGVLNHPPKSLMDKFAQNLSGSGLSKIFTMPAEFWLPSLEPVIASYSFRIRHWQLGDETDKSFIGMKSLPQILSAIKQEFDRVGRNSQIGVHWDWKQPLPSHADMPDSFLSLNTEPAPNDTQLQEYLEQTKSAGIPRWVLIKPLPANMPLNSRAADLVRRMMVAQLGEADAVFAFNPFDPEFGLLHPDGSPTELFLPWRTAALALQETTFLGKFNMPNGSPNVVFAKPGEVLMVIWNDRPTTEKIYLGENVQISDLFGLTKPAETVEVVRKGERKTGFTPQQQVLHVGPVPIIVRKCSEPIARWRLAVQFQKKQLPSQFGEHQEILMGKNTFPQGVTVKSNIEFSDKWNIEQPRAPQTLAPGEDYQVPVSLSFPSGAGIGQLGSTIDFEISADREYRFTVYRPYTLGLGKINLDVNSYIERKRGRAILVVEQIITNNTDPLEILNFNCNLLIPGRRRQKRSVVKLGRGEDRKFYWIPNAESLIGQQISLRVIQVDGKRFLNKSWTVLDKPPTKKP